jgi:ubiquinone/menaquinone biosynthesis C-methylase UbiE
LLVLVLAGSAAEPELLPPPRYEYQTDHDPDGTGKFYMGREIAEVMGHQAAGWLERPEREEEEAPSKVIELLKVRKGDVIADIGAGSGYYTFRLAELTGPKGRIYAVDIQPEMLTILRKGIKKRGAHNVEPIQGTVIDPHLPAGSCDLIIMVDVYHEFSHPWEMTRKMVEALKPDGRLVFVEYRKEDRKVPIKEVHKMSKMQVLKEMAPHAVRWVETNSALPWQHVIVFQKKTDEGAKQRN